MRTLKIGLLQQHNVADRTDNMMRLAKGIEDLAKRGAQLIVLQELHNSLYFCQVEDVNNFDLAEPIPGPSTGFYGELAKQFGVVIVTSLFEKRAPGLYHNTAVVIEKDGSIAGKYRKMHIPDDPAYYEKFYFTPGDLGFHPIQTSVGLRPKRSHIRPAVSAPNTVPINAPATTSPCQNDASPNSF
jgi:N-carbamoylputrescine amidase